ncbi:MAG TPA: PDZ domain-containing protein [Candidatus Acidoferrales bacterium]|nr:PDZ domain-containing protein [Candidatus Acidoferrales bacterium]
MGLVVGDILLTFNNAPITSLDELYRLLTRGTIGKTVELGILRAEKVVKLTIIPDENVDE